MKTVHCSHPEQCKEEKPKLGPNIETYLHIYLHGFFSFFLESIDIADNGQEVTKTAPAASKSVPPNELCYVKGEQIV